MILYRCKMCGGTLEIQDNQSIAVCEYCGIKQTLPKLNDEHKVNLYDRANHFRRNNEFDKAMSIYETILNEDSTDAEAYWSLVLCKYGIEYVDDPQTHIRIPTVNRTQFASVFSDENYQAALRCADSNQHILYEEEAHAIHELQKEILEISSKEEPFDVFICYKESNAGGERTEDSVLAQDIYYQLTERGFKVFFARITLENKLGQQYEPYIFAALNSAKVMVIVGTKPEYYNAVWVKNEWSRFLKLAQEKKDRLMIPAYKDMNPYDLPDALSYYQALDMSKIGFIQDLIRGIEKVLTDPGRNNQENPISVQEMNSNQGALLKRGKMALEDKEWEKAFGHFEQVLNMDAECAEAYLGQALSCKCASNSKEYVTNRLRETEEVEPLEHCIEAEQELYKRGKENGLSISPQFAHEKKVLFYSEEEQRRDQLQKERAMMESDKLLNKAVRFGSDSIKKEIESLQAELFAKMEGRIQIAITSDRERRESAQREAGEWIEKTFADNLEQLGKEYDKLYGVYASGKVVDYVLLSIRFSEMGDFRDAQELSKALLEKSKYRQRRIKELGKERGEIHMGYSELGLFSGKKRRKMEDRLNEINAELDQLNEVYDF